MWGISKHTALRLLAIALVLPSVGCPTQVNESSLAIPQRSGSGTAYYTENVQFIWSGDSLRTLQSLTIEHTGPVRVISGPSSQLLVWVQADVQSQDKARVMDDFKGQFRKASALSGNHPAVRTPPWICTEKHDKNGKLESVQGVCARELLIALPRSGHTRLNLSSWSQTLEVSDVQLPRLDVALPSTGSAALKNIDAPVSIRGGGTDSVLTIQGATSLRADLDSIRQAMLDQIETSVFVDVRDPLSGTLYLDGQLLDSFPYTRQ